LPYYADARYETPTPSVANPTQRWLWPIRGGIVAAAMVLYGWGAGERGLWSHLEGRAAQAAQNILDSGDWLLPRLHTGVVETQKPPMYAWLAAGSATLTGGLDGWSLRLPSLLASLVALLIVFEFGRAIGGLSVGLIAAVVLGCTTRFAWLARVGRIDMALTAAVLGCLYLFWNARVRRVDAPGRSRLSLGFYVALSVAVLLKGPVALALAGLPIFIWMVAIGRPMIPFVQHGGWREWRDLRALSGTMVLLAFAGSWFAYADLRTAGTFTSEFFFDHNLGRLLGADEALRGSPWWAYLPRIAVDFFPWSMLLPVAGYYFWKTRDRWRRAPLGPTYAFLLAWFLGTFLFLSAVRFKRMDYLLPVYPAAALLLACWLDDRRKRFFQRRMTTVAVDYRGRSQWILASAFLLAAVAAPLIFWGERQFTRKGGLAKTILQTAVLERHLNDTDEFMMLRVESILREHWPLLGILLPGLVTAVWLLHTGWHDRFVGRFTAGLAVPWAICFLMQIQVVMPRLDGLRDMQRFAHTIRHLAGDGRTIYYFDEFDADLVFHAGKPARLVERWEDLVELARNPTPVFVVLRTDQWKSKAVDDAGAVWREIANNCQFAKHREPRSFLTNRPDEVAERLRIDVETFLR
jgi:4-amino-4-deoxy-L-arabinose transferase-like glycosyltransferase